jgi:hypothetical protein
MRIACFQLLCGTPRPVRLTWLHPSRLLHRFMMAMGLM